MFNSISYNLEESPAHRTRQTKKFRKRPFILRFWYFCRVSRVKSANFLIWAKIDVTFEWIGWLLFLVQSLEQWFIPKSLKSLGENSRARLEIRKISIARRSTGREIATAKSSSLARPDWTVRYMRTIIIVYWVYIFSTFT